MASEKEQRVLSKNQIIRDVYCEAMPFLFTKSGGGGEIRMTECAMIQDLYGLVLGYLEEHRKVS
jgi:hypothetical protein